MKPRSSLTIVLYQPQIPQNAGNIVRTCAVTGSELVFIRPLGFSTTDRWLKRAGLDYWEGVNVTLFDSFDEYLFEQSKSSTDPFFFSSYAQKLYTSLDYRSGSHLIFGSETDGLPKELFEKYPSQFATIPMISKARCLNLATSVGIVTYEAIRQLS